MQDRNRFTKPSSHFSSDMSINERGTNFPFILVVNLHRIFGHDLITTKAFGEEENAVLL